MEIKNNEVHDNFDDRQKNLNAQLEAIEKSLNKHKNHTESRVPRLEDLSGRSQPRRKIKGYRGKQSIFKRPEGPAPRTKVSIIPDYRKNPGKWTCYNLDDVTEMSNESNSQAAFDFLKELEQRRERKTRKLLEVRDKRRIVEDAMDIDEVNDYDAAKDDEDSTVISFKKPTKRKEPTGKLKPEFKNNKVVMPEYEVGQKKATKKNNLSKTVTEKIDKNKEMKLDHLLAQDDGEE